MCLWRQDKKLASRSSNWDQNEDVSVVKWYQNKTFLRLLLSGCIVAGIVGLKSLHSYCNRDRALLACSLDHGKLDPSKLQTFANEVLALTKTKRVTGHPIVQKLNGLVLYITIFEKLNGDYLYIDLSKNEHAKSIMTIISPMAQTSDWELKWVQSSKEPKITGSKVVKLTDQVLEALNAKSVKLTNVAYVLIGGEMVPVDFMKMIENKTTTFYGARGYQCNGADDDQVAQWMENIYNYDIAPSPAIMNKLGDLGYSEFGPCMKKLYEKKEYERFGQIYQELEELNELPPDWKKLNEACTFMTKKFKPTPGVGDPCDHNDKCQEDLICKEYAFGNEHPKICVKDTPKSVTQQVQDLNPKFERSACNAPHNILPLVFVHFVFICLYFYLY